MLSGMEGLLRAQRVETMSFEYALGWHPEFAGSGAVPRHVEKCRLEEARRGGGDGGGARSPARLTGST